jgi:hypothetical protein
VNGLLYNFGDASDLADKIQIFAENQKLMVAVGRSGPESVEKIMSNHYAEDVIYKIGVKLKNEPTTIDAHAIAEISNSFTSLKETYIQTLYIDTGSGFRGENAVAAIVIEDDEHCFVSNYTISKFTNITSIRFDPRNGRCCRCRLISIQTDGNYEGIRWANSCSRSESWDYFMTDRPMYVLNGDFRNATTITIHGQIEVLTDEEVAEKCELLRQESELLKLELQSIYKTRSWRWTNIVSKFIDSLRGLVQKRGH